MFTVPGLADLRTGYSHVDPQYEAEQTLISWKGEFDLTDLLSLTRLGSDFESEIHQSTSFGNGGACFSRSQAMVCEPLALSGIRGRVRPG